MKTLLRKLSVGATLAVMSASFFLSLYALPVVNAAPSDGFCNGGDATITAPPSGSFVGGVAVVVSWAFVGIDCTTTDPSVLGIEVSHDATHTTWTLVATSATAVSTSVTFDSTFGLTPDDSDYKFRLNKGGSIIDTTAYQDVTIDNTKPVPTAANITASGGTGTGSAFIVGDTVTAVWDASVTGDNDANMSGANGSVSFDLSQFGAGAAVAANDTGAGCDVTPSDFKWTACDTVVAGVIDTATAKAVVSAATDAAGNVSVVTPVSSTTNYTVDNEPLTITGGNIAVTGATGVGGEFIIGDTVTVAWDNSGLGDNNLDTIVAVAVDFTQFEGGAAVAANDSGSGCGDVGADGIWTACFTVVAGTNNNVSGKQVTVSAQDNAGNLTSTLDDGSFSLDNVVPTGTVVVGTAQLYEGDLVQEVTVTYNEAMDPLSTPTITFVGSGAIITPGVGAWSVGNTVWTQNFTFSDVNEDVTGVTAGSSLATDAAGNPEGPDVGDSFDIDTDAPVFSDNGTLTITTDGTIATIANIGDKVTQSAPTITTPDGDVVTIDVSTLTNVGADATLATGVASGTIVDGASNLDSGAATFTITATDNAGNTNTTLSDAISADNVAPTVTDGAISIAGGTGTGGAYKIGDTITVTWNDVTDANGVELGSATANLLGWGGSSAQAMTDTVACGGSAGDNIWEACYTLIAGAIDGSGINTAVTATDNAGNVTTTADTTGATVDNIALTVTAANIGLSGATGTGGAFKIGDIIKATWNSTGDGNALAETASVNTDLSAFGGGAAVAMSDSGGVCDTTGADGTWSACYTFVAGAIDGTSLNVTVTATDNAANVTGPVSGTNNATADNIAPIITVSGTVTVTTNNVAGATAAITDGVTFNAGTVSVGDTDTWTANLSTVTGVNPRSSGVENPVIAGAVDNAAYTVSEIVTDNAGNTATDSTGAFDVDNIAPIVTVANISVTGATGTGGAFKFGNAPVSTWNNTAGGDNNGDIASVAFNSANFKAGDTALAGVNGAQTWTASLSGAMDSQDDINNNTTVSATDDGGNVTIVAGTNNYTVDSIIPTVSGGNLSATGANGTLGAFKFGDTATYHWSQTGDGETDTIASATFNANQFRALDTALVGVFSAGDWAIAGGVLDSQDDTGNDFTVTVVDNAGNSAGPVSSGPAYVVDTIVPVVTGANVDVTGATGVSGEFIIGDSPLLRWNQTADGETDTLASATFNGTSFKAGDTALVGAFGGGFWTTLLSGAIDTEETTGNTVTVTVIDDAGNSTGPTTSSTSYTIDTIAPTLPTVTIASDNADPTQATTGDTVTVTATANESLQPSPSATFTSGAIAVTNATVVGGGPTIWTLEYLVDVADTDGIVAFNIPAVSVVDLAGNVMALAVTGTTDASSVTVDQTGPGVTFTDPAANAVINNPVVDIAVDTTGTAVACQYDVVSFVYPSGNAMTVSGVTSFGKNFNPLANGTYTYFVQCVDAAGNASTEQSRSFTVTVHSIQITSPAPGASVSGVAAVFNFTTDGGATTAGEVSIDGGAFTTVGVVDGNPAAFTLDTTTLTNGSHNLTARDTVLGVVGISFPLTFIVSNVETVTPPVPVITTGVATVNSDTYTIVGTAAADTPSDTVRTISVFEGATLVGTAIIPVGQTDWSVVVSLNQNAANVFTATSTDAFGNVSAASTSVTITEDPTVGADVTAPAGLTVTSPGGSTTVDAPTFSIEGTLTADTDNVVINIWHDLNADATIDANDPILASMTLPPGVTGWAGLVPLDQNTTNDFLIEALDPFGNAFYSLVPTITDNASGAADVTAPTISYTPIANQFTAGSVPANIVYTIADNIAVTTLTEQDGGPATNVFGSFIDPLYTQALSGTVGLHEYILTAGDAAGNTVTTTVTYNVVAAGVTAINIDAFTITGLSNTGVTVDWTTDQTASSSVVDFFTSGSQFLNQAATITLTNNNLVMAGLTANTQYTVVLKSQVAGQSGFTTLTLFITTATSAAGVGVSQVLATQTFAIADNTLANGFQWKLNFTANNMAETSVQFKLSDLVSGVNIIAATNASVSVDGTSCLVSTATCKVLTAANTYSASMTYADLNALLGGLQGQLTVTVKVPVATPGGNYGGSYGLQTL